MELQKAEGEYSFPSVVQSVTVKASYMDKTESDPTSFSLPGLSKHLTIGHFGEHS